MTTQLIFCIDNQHYVNFFNFLRVLSWLARSFPDDRFVITGNICGNSLLTHLDEESRKRFHPIEITSPQIRDSVLTRKSVDALTAVYPNYPRESLGLADVLIPDRCLAYFNTMDLSEFISSLFRAFEPNRINLIGGCTDHPVDFSTLFTLASSAEVPVYGFPCGNVVGRYAPYWLPYCAVLYLFDIDSAAALRREGVSKSRISLLQTPKLVASSGNESGRKVVIDLGIHSPRHVLLDVVNFLSRKLDLKEIQLNAGQFGAFYDFIARYLSLNGLAVPEVGNFLNSLFSARLVLSLFPYSAYYLLDNFDNAPPVRLIDLSKRYATVDGLFADSPDLLTDLSQLEGVI